MKRRSWWGGSADDNSERTFTRFPRLGPIADHFPMRAATLFAKPDFLIIGTQKGGTTSLYDYLCRHPQVLHAAEKELHYFDNQYDRSRLWYRSRFPLLPRKSLRQWRTGGRVVTGEATPMYLVHPHAPGRIAQQFPGVRLIVILRNPAHRAYSQYQHNVRMGWEPLSFEEAIEREDERIADAHAAMLADPLLVDTRFHAWSYKTRGRYIEQIMRYDERFPREQLLVLGSEEFFASPAEQMSKVERFLGIADLDLGVLSQANEGGYSRQLPSAVERLKAYFAPYNEQLFEYLGRRMDWS